MLIHVENEGPLIVRSDYWDSEVARAGKVFCSVNAGSIRVLLPPSRYLDLPDMRAARCCALSRGPWPEAGATEAVEILFDDGSDSPYVIHLTPESFDLMPAEPEPGREWKLSVWTPIRGEPWMALERVCHWRRVPHLPWLQPWAELKGGG